MMFVRLIKSLLLLFAAAAIMQALQNSSAQNFRFNPFVLLSVFTVITNLILLYIVNRPRMRNRVTLWFSMYLTLLTTWAICEGLGRLAADIPTAIFWSNWATLGWALMPAAFLIFTRIYAGSQEELSRPSLLLAIFVAPFVFLVMNLTTDLIVVRDIASITYEPWGISLENGRFFVWFLIWLETMFLAGIYTLVKFLKRTKDINQKRQVKIFLVSTMIPLVGGSITDGVMPIVGTTVFPTATLLVSIMSLVIVYGIRRYGLFVISPAAYSDTILQTMKEAVIGADSNFNIQYINEGAQNIFGAKPGELSGASIASVFSNSVISDLLPKIMRAMKTQDTMQIEEIEVMNPARGAVPVNLTIHSVRSGDGVRAGYIFVFIDISVEKRLVLDLRKERDTVEAIIGSMAESLVVIDNKGKMTMINPAAERSLGITLKDFIGHSFKDVVEVFKSGKPLTPDEYLLSRTLREGRPIIVTRNDNYELKTRDGNTFPFVAHTAPIRIGGEITGAMVIFHDITEEKRDAETIERKVAEQTQTIWEEEAKLDASIQGLELGFIMLDSNGDISTVNNYAGSLLGAENLTEGIVSIDKALSIDLKTKFEESLKSRTTIEIPEVTFSSKIFNITLSPIIMSNEAIGGVILIDDVTEEKLLQRSRDEFFAIASHELRTPLTAIRGNASMIQGYYAEAMKDEELRTMIEDIYKSSVLLIGVVNDFLDASRLEQGKMIFSVENFDIQDVIHDVIHETAATAKEKSVTIVLDELPEHLPQAYADKNKIKQVVYNLVGNALKFTEEGKIRVSLKEDDGNLKIRIADSGKGIAPDKQAGLFHKFHQAGNSILTRDNTRGTGLGLYISKLLTERMGGTIGLEKSDSNGTTFYFTVPVYRGDAAKTQQSLITPLQGLR